MPEYICLSRRDREVRGGGGVATYARKSLVNVVDLYKSPVAERIYSVYHSNLGDILIVNWYRPPDEDPDLIANLSEEYTSFLHMVVGAILAKCQYSSQAVVDLQHWQHKGRRIIISIFSQFGSTSVSSGS